MKSTFITLTAVASLVGYSNAALIFKDPWSQSKAWKSGQPAHISWTSEKGDADKLCDIQMLNGEATNSNIVATVTNPDQPVRCGVNEFEIAPLNDFKTGKYWLRIGEAKTNTWAYSGVFNFEGKGTAYPLKLADGTSSDYPTAEAPKDDAMTNKETTKEEKKKEKKKEEKKERKEAAPKLASQGPSSSASEAKATGSASNSTSSDPAKSSLLSAPTNNSKGSMPPTVKKDTKDNEHEKKMHSSAVSFVHRNDLSSYSAAMGLVSLAAYFLI